MALSKTYLYKVYTSAGVYIKTWAGSDVASEFEKAQDINSPGSELVVKLARSAGNFGEGSDINFRNKVKVYVIDSDQPNGALIFQGFISKYRPLHGVDEHVEVTLLGYGAELDNNIIEIGESTYLEQHSTNETEYVGMDDSLGVTPNQAIAQTVQFTEDVEISAIEILQSRGPTSVHSPVTIECDVYASDVTASSPFSSGSPVLSGPVATKVLTTMDVSATALKFLFATPFTIPANTAYSFVFIIPESARPVYGYDAVTLSRSNLNSFAGGAFLKASETGTGRFSAISARDLWFTLYKTDGNTISPFLSKDPGAIMREIMDDYIAKGGALSYDATTIELTSTTVSYTFNTNTTLEGIQKCLELAPANWYWYVDEATNMVHFHLRPSTLEHKFTLGRDIGRFSAERRVEDIINTVYFTGGDGLFVKKSNATSVALYGVKLMRYQDQRVTLEATAETIIDAILGERAAPEVRVEIDVTDSNAQSKGYDIETITIGDVVGFRAFEAYMASLWDVANWDEAYWDFNVAQVGTLILQIVRLEYSPAGAKLFLSTTPPDVNKRIEDINRNLIATITANNPAAPDVL